MHVHAARIKESTAVIVASLEQQGDQVFPPSSTANFLHQRCIAFNGIFGKVGRIAYENVVVELL